MTILKKYSTNTLWLLFEKIIRLVSGFFIGVLVARYLGPEKLGILSFSQSYVGLLVVFTNLGLDSIIVRELIKQQYDERIILSTAFAIKMCSSLLLFFVIGLSIFLTNIEHGLIITILSISYLFSPFNVLDCYYQSKVNGKIISLVKILALIITSSLKVFAIVKGLSIEYFASIIMLESAITGMLFIFAYCKKEKFHMVTFDKGLALLLLKQSWPLLFSGFFISIYMKIDQIMIRCFTDLTQVGIYSIAVRLSELWYFIPTVLSTSLFPLMVRQKEQSYSGYLDKMSLIYCSVFWFAVILSVTISIFAKQLVLLVYGEDYAMSGDILIIHIWSSLFVFLGVFIANQVVLEERQKVLLLGVVLGALTNVLLNLVLIKWIGVKGAAYATLISQSIASVFYLSFFTDLRWILKFVLKSLSIYSVLRLITQRSNL
ncbi:flippase [Vibrio parahaemolyticus]|nr:flippase [Vibrio parahaemolyticus]EJG2032357.1 flippase [Vibrio parahaemolyticus]